MLQLSGYTNLTPVAENGRVLVYRARARDGGAVLLKMLRSEYPTPAEIDQFRREYEVMRSARIEGIPEALAFESYQNGNVLVLRDSCGVSLDRVAASGALGVPEFLKIAIKMLEVLEGVHAQKIIHRDIKPANVTYVAARDSIEIIDFGLAIRYATRSLSLEGRVAGSLAYLSPEQTGRINRSVDHRSDLYSAGITFYELLTGKLPFDGKDPMELVHAHIAKKAAPAHEVRSAIPRVLSKIIEKLMMKSADDRYQSAKGAAADLRKIADTLATGLPPGDFELGQSDDHSRFVLAQKLYGREVDVALLQSLFDEASRGPAKMILIDGDPGIGKSALVAELGGKLVERAGYFISGKFDQFRRDVPFSAVVEAMNGLV